MSIRPVSRLSSAIALALAAAACSEGGERPLSVVLITLDTTRRDALDSFGGSRGVAPNLDRLAREGVRYLEARTVAPLTLPAHASMLTGLYPLRHSARINGPGMLPREARTVAELASERGIDTAAFVGSLALDRAYGVAQGFATWSQPEAEGDTVVGQASERRAGEVVRDARAWLSKHDPGERFLLWVHVYDPHAPYEPPPESLGSGSPYYDEVAGADAALGELFAGLDLSRTLLVVASDHGEGLGEHGEDTHGEFVWDSTLRVPMFVRYPDGFRAGEASDETVTVADVAPTVLEALGIEPPADLDGISLYRRRAPEGRGAYFESISGWERFRWSPLVGWCDREGKYVHSSSPRLARPREDPGEERDLLPSAGGERYVAALRELAARPRIETKELAPASERTAEAVATLGYGSLDLEAEPPEPLLASDLPAPERRLDEYRDFREAEALHRAGRFEEAVPLLERVLAGRPDNPAALDELGSALVELGRWEEALEVLARRAALPPERLATHRGMIRCLLELGRAEEARAHTLRALELLIEIHGRRGEPEVAERYRSIYEAELSAGASRGR